jgi:hypothetical protein
LTRRLGSERRFGARQLKVPHASSPKPRIVGRNLFIVFGDEYRSGGVTKTVPPQK